MPDKKEMEPVWQVPQQPVETIVCTDDPKPDKSVSERERQRLEFERKWCAAPNADPITHPGIEPVQKHEGRKYLVEITSATKPFCRVTVDVYSVIDAFRVTCPGRQQALKKLLFAGARGKGTAEQDLVGAIAALNRAVELEQQRNVPK